MRSVISLRHTLGPGTHLTCRTLVSASSAVLRICFIRYTSVSAREKAHRATQVREFHLIHHYASSIVATKAFFSGTQGSAGSTVFFIAIEVSAYVTAYTVRRVADAGTVHASRHTSASVGASSTVPVVSVQIKTSANISCAESFQANYGEQA